MHKLAIWIMLLILLMGCLSPMPLVATVTPTASATATWTPLPPTPTAAPSQTPTITPIPSTPEPLGCQKPPDDYTRLEVNGWTINQRTFAMLAHAQELYGGELELTGHAVTQGSYHDNGSYSFGTHLGGGAVDLSVMRYGTYTVLWDDVEPLLRALRAAGFAAWFRDYGEVYQDSPYHIHAIAIGDRELSPEAANQLTGPAGYFRGYSGLPFPEGKSPTPDRYGGPIICQWMIELGYSDLR
ncbi:MAG TPA: hypothetical protein VHP14_09610 [Anaerolineales bacterium]|nr:hypothetical protein [Anaerolineales bacterium]